MILALALQLLELKRIASASFVRLRKALIAYGRDKALGFVRLLFPSIAMMDPHG